MENAIRHLNVDQTKLTKDAVKMEEEVMFHSPLKVFNKAVVISEDDLYPNLNFLSLVLILNLEYKNKIFHIYFLLKAFFI